MDLEKLKAVRLVATDFDGVHTDGSVYVDETGKESVRVSRKDGLGYDMLRRAGINACIISKEVNAVVAARAGKLKIDCYQAVSTSEGKSEILQRIAQELKLLPEQVLYLGDDINDLQALGWAGVPACPRDAHPLVVELVRTRDGYIAKQSGGDGVVREITEAILNARGVPLAF